MDSVPAPELLGMWPAQTSACTVPRILLSMPQVRVPGPCAGHPGLLLVPMLTGPQQLSPRICTPHLTDYLLLCLLFWTCRSCRGHNCAHGGGESSSVETNRCRL